MNSAIQVLYPEPVRPGDTVGIVMPSSMMTIGELQQTIKAVERLGLNCKVGPETRRVAKMFTTLQKGTVEQDLSAWSADEQNEYNQYIVSGYMAGDPQKRAADINQFFTDPDAKAIWCQRGGFGSSRIMPYLDYDLIRQHPKQIVGYSDCTNVIAGIYQNAGLITCHGPMVWPNFAMESRLVNGQVDSYTWANFHQLAMEDWQSVTVRNPDEQPTWTVRPGQAAGRIVGGNLSMLAHAVGTNFAYDTTDKIVFIEESREHVPYIDMNLTQLENSGYFKHINGLIIGDMLNCHNRTGNDKAQSWGADELIKSHFADAPFPVLAHVKLGHDIQTMTVPVGSWCELDADNGEMRFIKR